MGQTRVKASEPCIRWLAEHISHGCSKPLQMQTIQKGTLPHPVDLVLPLWSQFYLPTIVTVSKLAMANKSGDEVLGQGLATLFGKLGVQEYGALMS